MRKLVTVLIGLTLGVGSAIAEPEGVVDQPLRGGIDPAAGATDYRSFSAYVLRGRSVRHPESAVGAHTAATTGHTVIASGLRGAIEAAVQTNPGMRAAVHDARAARAQVWKQLAAFTPVVTATVNHRLDAGGFDAVSRDVLHRSAGLELSLPLFTSGRRYFAVQGARARQRASIYRAMSVRDDLTLRVVNAWMRSVSGSREIAAMQKTARNLAGLEAAVASRVKAGFAATDDLALVRADRQSLERAIADATARRDKARADFARQSRSRIGEGADLPDLDRYVAGSVESVLENARRKNPQLRAAAETYYGARADSRASFASNLPQVELVGQYRHATGDAAATGDRDGWNIGAQLRVPLVNLAGWAETAAQSERTSAALYREAEALRTVDYQVETLWSDFTAARQSLSAARAESRNRARAATAARARYRKGLGDLETAVLREREAVTADVSLLGARVNIQIVAAQLLLLSGEFDISMLSPRM